MSMRPGSWGIAGIGFVAGALAATMVFSAISGRGAKGLGKGKTVTGLAEAGDGLVGSVDLANAFDIDDPRISFRVLKRIAEVRALEDPVSAVQAALSIPGHDNREAYLAAALQTWGEIDGQVASEWCFENFEGELLTDALYFVADGWAESDPEAAGKWYNDNTDADIREDALWEVLESWGRKNPEDAFEWSKGLEEDAKWMVMDGLAEGWAAVDPAGAAEAGLTMQGESYEYDFLTGVATQWGGLDPEAAAEWGQRVLHDAIRDGVFLEVGEIWAHSEPALAAEYGAKMEEGENRTSMLSGIAIGWSEHDPDGAAEWVLGLETADAHRRDMLGDIIFNWSNIDPAGTVEWLEAQEPGNQRDEFLSVFGEIIMGVDPEASVAWANEISDPVVRDENLRKLIDRWIKIRGVTAYETLEGMDLPSDVKSEFLNN